MTEAEAEVHPHRHILTRALGVGPDVDVDLWELHVKTGDRLLLCSDGLTNEVDHRADRPGPPLGGGPAQGRPGAGRPGQRPRGQRQRHRGGGRRAGRGGRVPEPSRRLGVAGKSVDLRAPAPRARSEGPPSRGAAVMVRRPLPVPQAVRRRQRAATGAASGDVFVASPTPVGVQTLPAPPVPGGAARSWPRRPTRRGASAAGGSASPAGSRSGSSSSSSCCWRSRPAGSRWCAGTRRTTGTWPSTTVDLAVYQGRQGGFLGFKPKLLDLTERHHRRGPAATACRRCARP